MHAADRLRQDRWEEVDFWVHVYMHGLYEFSRIFFYFGLLYV